MLECSKLTYHIQMMESHRKTELHQWRVKKLDVTWFMLQIVPSRLFEWKLLTLLIYHETTFSN